MYNKLSSQFISLFDKEDEYFEEQSRLFEERYELSGIYAAIDGTCVPFKAPHRDDWYSYINKNGIIAMKS